MVGAGAERLHELEVYLRAGNSRQPFAVRISSQQPIIPGLHVKKMNARVRRAV
jgi:hypothetical protein